jgi:hypothetical protein
LQIAGDLLFSECLRTIAGAAAMMGLLQKAFE